MTHRMMMLYPQDVSGLADAKIIAPAGGYVGFPKPGKAKEARVIDGLQYAKSAQSTATAKMEDAQPVTGNVSDDGWIEWAGGDCPVPVGTLIDIKRADDLTFFNVEAKQTGEWISEAECRTFYWEETLGYETHIIAYRFHKPQ